MHAYANPPADRRDIKNRADGFGIARFNKETRSVTYECWPRFADVSEGDEAQFPDGRLRTICPTMMDAKWLAGYLSLSLANPTKWCR
jgi:hypothetical protein